MQRQKHFHHRGVCLRKSYGKTGNEHRELPFGFKHPAFLCELYVSPVPSLPWGAQPR